MGEEQFKWKSMKETFEENYKAVKVPAKNKKGFKMEYVYVGAWMVWEGEAGALKKEKIFILNTCFLSLLLYAAAALQNAQVNAERMVAIPGLLSLAAAVFMLFGVFQFYFSKERLTEESFKDIAAKLRIAPVFYALLLFLCAGAALYKVITGGFAGSGLLIAMCYFLAGLGPLSIRNHFRRLHFRKEESVK